MPNARFETFDNPIPYFVNAALNSALAVATTFANLVVLLAMRHVTSIRLPSKLLLCSLVLTDLGAGSVVQPQFAALLFSRAVHPGIPQCLLNKTFLFTGSMFSGASFLTLAAISLDRYAALFFHLDYQRIVTTRRIFAVLALVWSMALFWASTLLWKYELWLTFALIVAAVTFATVSVAFIKIYRRLKTRQVESRAPQQTQQRAGNTLNMDRYQKLAFAMITVYVIFIVCYVPYICLSLVVRIIGYTALTMCLWGFAYTIVLLNSFMNPLVYCLLLPEIRIEFKKLLLKIVCLSSPQ